METQKTIAQLCPGCDEAVSVYVFGTYEDRLPQGPTFRYDAGVCPKCTRGMFFVSEDYGLGFDEEGPYRVYPAQEKPLSGAIPENLRKDLGEARRCFKAKCFTATAIMVRRTIENLCAEHNAKGANLFDRLKVLKDEGIIESRLYEWADLLRLFGNEGAHGGASVAKDEAEEALVMAEAVLDYVYSFQHRYSQFKTKINKRKTEKK